MEAIEDILIELGLRDLTSNFVNNKVGPKEVLLLTEEEFCSLGLVTIGDKARLRQRCRAHLNGSISTSPLIKEIQSSMKRKTYSKAATIKKKKHTRKLYVGWKHSTKGNLDFRQVPLSKGGGSLSVDVEKDMTLDSLTELIKGTFFPGGKATLKDLAADQCKFYLASFSGNAIDDNLSSGDKFTVEKYFEEVKTTPQRIYLHSYAVHPSQDTCTTTSVGSNLSQNPSTSSTAADINLPENLLTTVVSNIPDNLSTSSATVGCSTASTSTTTQVWQLDISDSDDELPNIVFPVNTGTPTIIFNIPNNQMLENSSQNSPETLQDILKQLHSQTMQNKNLLNVDRDDVLKGARRAFSRSNFHPEWMLNIRFSGEFGIDDGGPRREFMRLALRQIRDSPIFQGSAFDKILCPDVNCEEGRYYAMYGQMIAYIIVHKGPAPAFFSHLMYDLVAYGSDAAVPTIDDIVDLEIKNHIQKFMEAEGTSDYFNALEPLFPIIDYIGAMGLTTKKIKRDDLCRILCKHLVVERIKGVLDQFTDGLELLGVLDKVRKHPQIMKELFVREVDKSLDGWQLDLLFTTVLFSEEGSNKYKRELKTHTNFRDFLQDLEGIEDGIKNLLVYITAFEEIPPLGFEPNLSLQFHHPEGEDDTLPFANTCSNTLTIPVIEDFDIFKDRMMAAIEFGTFFTSA